jgi:hypothetical protein
LKIAGLGQGSSGRAPAYQLHEDLYYQKEGGREGRREREGRKEGRKKERKEGKKIAVSAL